ncbi:O-antigen ligase family protein, partial [Candidatus Microgenomates bacterium]|nr:O-antigen ligase family protein [Candidatus Microgenomates bacterium]
MMILISGAIVAFYGVLEHFGIDKDYWVQDVQNRVFSTLGQPNWLAAYLSILIPIAIVFGIQKTQNTQKASKSEKSDSLNFRSTDSLVHRVFRVFWIFLPLLFYLTLLYTKSRSGFVGLWIGLAFFVGTYFWHQRQTLKNITLKKFIGIYWYLLVVLVFIGSITFVVGAPFEQLKPFTLDGIGSKLSKQLATSNQQLVKAQGTALEIGGTESGEIRKIVWQGAIDIAKHYPLFGSGVETFAYSYYQYRPVEHNLTSEWDFLYNKAHNEYLNYLATTGAFGLGSYLLIIIVFLLLSTGKISNLKFTIFNENLKFKIKNYEDDFLSAILSFALITAYISILVSNFFGFSVVIINLFL